MSGEKSVMKDEVVDELRKIAPRLAAKAPTFLNEMIERAVLHDADPPQVLKAISDVEFNLARIADIDDMIAHRHLMRSRR